MYNIYSIVILILFDIPRFSVNDLHQIQVAAPSCIVTRKGRPLDSVSLYTSLRVAACVRARVRAGVHVYVCMYVYMYAGMHVCILYI